MPLDVDYEFGNLAVRRAALRQDQLEECVEVLVALERVGSRKRLWDIVAGKGYMDAAAAKALQEEVLGLSPPAGPEHGDAADETADDIPVVVPDIGGFVLAWLRGDEAPRILELPQRLIVLGSDPSCDIHIDDEGVEPTHARMTCGHGQFSITDNRSQGGLFVNGTRTPTRRLMPNDLIGIGSARLLFLAEYGEKPAPQTDTPSALHEAPTGRLRVTDGPNEGAAFFVGSQTRIIGRHRLASIRIENDEVAEFCAQIVPLAGQARIVDLGSSSRVQVNDQPLAEAFLRNNDKVAIGPVTLTFTDMTPGQPLVAPVHREHPPSPRREDTSRQETVALPPPAPGQEKWEFDISLDAEVDVPSDPLVRAGIKAGDNLPERERVIKPYRPGQLKLICFAGPGEGRSYMLRKERTALGRDPRNDVTVDNPSISRRHAEIVLDPKHALLADLGSRNGVFVNGKRVQKAALCAGDTLRIGDCLFILEEVVPSSPSR